MEEEVYEVPRLPIKPYEMKLDRAIAQIHERYEDLGLKIASDLDPVDRKTELGYSIEGRLVIFQVIDEPELLKELGPNALATNKPTVDRKIIIGLQEILFRMDPDILAIVLQQQLDEVLFILEGMSREKAYDEASKLISSEDRTRIKEAFKIQIDLELKQLVEEQRKNKHIKVASRATKSGSSEGRRKYNRPGKEKLRQLIIKYQAKLSDIAEDPDINASQPIVSNWINADTDLKQLAEEQRRIRARKPRPERSKVSEIKSREQPRDYPGDKALKKLIIKYQGNLRKIANDSSIQVTSAKVMAWINNNLELRRLASEQRQRRKRRKSKVRVPSNPGKEILEALLINYKGDLKEMAGNPNINTDVETLRSWIEEEGIESLEG